jgi:signal transduction histidine kinase
MEAYPIKIHCSLDDAGEETMSGKFKLNIFRVFQEQLNNILKHARASTIHISFSLMKAGYTFTMEDNGVGVDTTKKMKGVGIYNIISRVELYKGEARFISGLGKGCLLVVHFPPSQN